MLSDALKEKDNRDAKAKKLRRSSSLDCKNNLHIYYAYYLDLFYPFPSARFLFVLRCAFPASHEATGGQGGVDEAKRQKQTGFKI